MPPSSAEHQPAAGATRPADGPEVSISFSATFQTALRDRWARVHRLNERLRRRGRTPMLPDVHPTLDRVKSGAEQVCDRADWFLHGAELVERLQAAEEGTYSGPGGTRVG